MRISAARRLLGQRPADPKVRHPAVVRAMAMLMVLVMLPHLLHLPIWVSTLGFVLSGLRVLASEYPTLRWPQRLLHPLLITLLAALAGVMLRVDYGYFLGRDPSVAFLFILVAAKFAEMRNRSDVTILLCLSMFLLITQYFHTQSILSALTTLPAVLALGNALGVARAPDTVTPLQPRLALVGTLLLQGLPLAALLFVVFPRLPGPMWSLPEDAMATSGLSDRMNPGSIGELSRSDAVAFRVEFDGPIPAPAQRYWRGPVMHEFDGRGWHADGTAVPVRLRGGTENALNYTVMLQPHRRKWLFALDQAVSPPRSSDQPGIAARTLGQLMSNGQILSEERVSQVLRYRQQSVPGASFDIGQAPAANTLALPGRNPRAAALAHDLRAGSGSDQEFIARVLAHFNTEPFHYTLRPQLLGDRPVDEFLFDTREGFCEHYASAFTVLLRAAGIPARVVTGYQGGEMNGDYMIVRQSDAHAWSEAWLDGRWRRFDPTAAVSPERVEQGISGALPDENALPRIARADTSDWLRQWQLRVDAVNHAWQRWVVDFDNDTQSEIRSKLGIPAPELWQITVGILGVAAIWVLLLLRSPFDKQTHPSREERAWRQVVNWLHEQGIERQPQETPQELLTRAAGRLPAQKALLGSLAELFDALRFQALDDDTRATRWAQWQRLKRELPRSRCRLRRCST
ncbi:MAG: transglutaminase [Gammaproteobacteria bacterium]|nr:MAG: transglutaminase [Gammaproteobacteria bacterium]